MTANSRRRLRVRRTRLIASLLLRVVALERRVADLEAQRPRIVRVGSGERSQPGFNATVTPV
ncbi:hypothetical protein ACAG26_06880 [Mycobacterium sp. pUA109]|uniref:hypothetical protein n=1 Tax=Mycobacterium sp. pUA109 TaxID=3238982 RepID=UPI00351B3D8F